MSESFIYVKPSADPERVKVLTELLGELEIPVYIGAHPDGTLIDEDNPSPIKLGNEDLSRNSNDTEIFVEILNQLKILNLYMAEGFNFTFTEEDIEDDHDY